MKFLISSDWHVDWTTDGWPRADDVIKSIGRTVQAANDLGVDLYVFCGDLMDGHDPDERVWTLLSRVQSQLDRLTMPALFIAGNHDVVDRVGCRSALAPLRSSLKQREVMEDVLLIQYPFSVDVLVLPHLSPAHVDLEYVGMTRTLQEYGEITLRDMLDGRTRPFVVFSHWELDEIHQQWERGSEEKMPRGARTCRVPQWLLEDERCLHVFSGHYHRHQEVGDKITVVGSMERLTFGERDDDKSFLFVEVNPW